jgi:hypothetical protein
MMEGGSAMENGISPRHKRPNLLEEVRSAFSDLLRMFELDGPVIVDSLVNSEVLRGIPVISQIVTMVKFQIDVKDALFASKI